MTTQAPNVEVLTRENPGSQAPSVPTPASQPPVPARCQHRFANGKRCRQSAQESQAGLCSHHFRVSNPAFAFPPLPNDSEDLSSDLLPELNEFSSGEDVQKFLARLAVQVTRGRISPRRASVLAYITNQLLHSHRAMDKESENEPYIFDLPRPQHD